MKNYVALLMVLLSFSVANAGIRFNKEVPTEIRTQLLTDLQFISSIQGSSASELHKKIYGLVDGRTYSQFFSSHINTVGLNSCGDPKAVACVIPMTGKSTMWLSPNYTKFSHPQIARLMVIFHEARHSEMLHRYWGHARCPNPFLDQNGKPVSSIWSGASLAGEPGCDKTAFGSYGSSLILLKNISKFCSNCTEKVKMDAGIYADDQTKRIIDQPSYIAIKKDLYSTSDTGKRL